MADTLILTDTQKCALAITPVDVKNNPAPVEGVPVWASSDEGAVAVDVAADGMSAVVRAVGPLTPGVQISVSADADLGEGVVPVVGLLNVQVVASQAVSVAISAGAPEEQ
jgi:hypothetical protein